VLCAVKAKAVACEIDAVGIVDEADENGVGVSRITDNIVPFVDWELAGDDCLSSTVAFFEDFEEIMPCSGIERFETPVIEDEELHAPKRPQESGIATIAARQREISEELGALIENGSVVAASPMAERASKPAFADAGRAAQDDVVVGIDPTALGQLLEQGAISQQRSSKSGPPGHMIPEWWAASSRNRWAACSGISRPVCPPDLQRTFSMLFGIWDRL
jgi:hypothetical protein